MPPRVLVIDDDPLILAMVTDFLTGAGFAVATAENAIYSNHLIYGRQPPDLILLDVMMPLMSGAKKALAIKRRNKSSAIPVLLISAKEKEELRRLAVESGADGYLPKPFTAERLVRLVRSALEGVPSPLSPRLLTA